MSSNACEYFEDDYFSAREQFRSRVTKLQEKAKAAGSSTSSVVELHSLPLEIKNDASDFPDGIIIEDLTIDIAVIRGGDSSKVLIVISGTHGVEGYAGSAVQCSILDDDDDSILLPKKNSSKKPSSYPTIVLVHGLNPFGFANNRRWNEHNVDLNRNCLTKEEFASQINRDPNEFGYVDYYDLFNPPPAAVGEGLFDGVSFWLLSISNIIRHGFVKLKQSLVSGNYHFSKSIFFGGTHLQQSHELVNGFLTHHFSNLNNVAVIDIHTGLGKMGQDTLFVDGNVTANIAFQAQSPLQKHAPSPIIVSKDNVDRDHAFKGYSQVVGITSNGVAKTLSGSCNAPQKLQSFAITQEFGTVPGILVFKALREENSCYQHILENSHDVQTWKKSSAKVRDAFYLSKNLQWKEKIVTRGKDLFLNVHTWLSSSYSSDTEEMA